MALPVESATVGGQVLEEAVKGLAVGGVRAIPRFLAEACVIDGDEIEAYAVLAVMNDLGHHDDGGCVRPAGMGFCSLQRDHDQSAEEPSFFSGEEESFGADVFDGMAHGVAAVPEIGDERRRFAASSLPVFFAED